MSRFVIRKGDVCVFPLRQLCYVLDHLDLMAERYFSRILYAVFSSLGRVTGGVPPKYSADLVWRSVIEVVRTRVVG